MPMNIRRFAAALAIGVPLSTVPAVPAPGGEVILRPPGERVTASWYGRRYHGRPTASGETFDAGRLTAAHPTLPFGTLVEVLNPADGRRVVVRINDRGPAGDRGIDLSEAAARGIGLIERGVAEVVLFPAKDAVGWQ